MSTKYHVNAEVDDLSSLTLTIDEIRWLHASEAILESPVKQVEIVQYDDCVRSPSQTSNNGSAHSVTTCPKPPLCILTPPTPIPTPPVQAPATSSQSSISIESMFSTSATPPIPLKRPSQTALKHKPSTSPLRTHPPARNTALNKNRHYHLGDGREEDVSSVSSIPTSISMDLPNLYSLPPSSRISPTPISITSPTQSSVAPTTSRSLPPPQRTEWIYRHPKPRPLPSLSLSTSTSPSNGSPTTTSSSPSSRTPIRTRTRSTSRHPSSNPKLRPRPRPQTGYYPQVPSVTFNPSKPIHIHSSLPPRQNLRHTSTTDTGTTTSTKATHMLWATLLRPRSARATKGKQAVVSDQEDKTAPELVHEILDISKPDSPPSLLQAENELSLSSRECNTSHISTRSSTSINTLNTVNTISSGSTNITVTTNPLSNSISTSPPRTRSSSSSSSSSASTSASTSTAATSASAGSSPTISSKLPASPSKSILSRASSTTSTTASSSRHGLAALLGSGLSGNTASVSSSAKSVTFVDAPIIHYPYAGFYPYTCEPQEYNDDQCEQTRGKDDEHDHGYGLEMGINMDQMDLDDPYTTPPLIRHSRGDDDDDPLEGIGTGYHRMPYSRTPTESVVKLENEGGLKRILSFTRRQTNTTGSMKGSKLMISGPFALGSLPSRTSPLPPPLSPASHAPISHSTTSLGSHHSITRSTSLQRTSGKAHLKSHSYTHPSKTSIKTLQPSIPSPGIYPTSLRTVPSLESFRSTAGRSVRSLGSIKSTASTRGFRAWLTRVGEGVGIGGEGRSSN